MLDMNDHSKHRSCLKFVAIWALLLVVAIPHPFAQQHQPLVKGLEAIGITVSDMDRAVDFYSKVLTFEKVSDTEVVGGKL
jgi:Glyoxalase/Bleomycin resistance protein/Dioxygenase superfamily